MTKAAKTKRSAKKPAPTLVPVTEAAPESVSGGKLVKTQLVEQMAAKARLSRKEADVAMATVLSTVVETLSVREMQAREGMRPGTSERIQLPAGRKVAFKVASALKGGL